MGVCCLVMEPSLLSPVAWDLGLLVVPGPDDDGVSAEIDE